jgi:cation-transporting P-type ATPase I
MDLLRRIESARASVGTAARLAVAGASLALAPVAVTAGLLGSSAGLPTRAVRSAAGAAGAVASGSLHLARTTALSGARAVGTVVTGADPFPDGHVRGMVDVARGMVEPPLARHTRRIWSGHDHGHGHVQVEIAAPAAEDRPEIRRALRRHLERLEGVEWATVNDVVGRVLVAFDDRRVTAEDVVGVVTAVEQARGGRQVFPQREDHPADLEPFLAAAVTAAVDITAVGVAAAAKVLPIPALSRHVTLTIALLDSQQWIKDGLEARIGPIGTDFVFSGTSALLHALTQSPTVPALNAVAAVQQVVEMRARRQVWRRREKELCGPEPEDDPDEPQEAPGQRPAPMPAG